MDDTKLPDLTEIRSGNLRDKELPLQKSPKDTSNWDERAFMAPTTDATREMVFRGPATDGIEPNPYLEQERLKAKYRKKKPQKKTNQQVVEP